MWFIIYTVVYMKSLEAGLAWWHPWITPLSATLNINTRHIRFEIEPFDASKDAVLVFESLWWQVVKYFPWSSNLRGFELCKISLHLKYVEPFEQGGRSFKCIETKDSRLKQISSETFSLIFRPYHSLVYIFLLPCFDDCGQAVDLLTFCVECPSKHLGQISYQRISPKCKQSKEMSMSTVSKSKNIFSFKFMNLTKINLYVLDWQSVLMAFIGLQELLQEGPSDSWW